MMILQQAAFVLRKVLWIIPGFLLFAAFPPMCETTDVLFALAPLIWLARQGERYVSARRWFASGFVFWLATLAWMPAIVKNGGPWPLVLLGWGVLAAYCSLFFAAFGFLSAAYWRWTTDRPHFFLWRLVGIFLVEPILWCGLELVRSRFLGGFAWNQLGVVPANAGFGAPAAWGGVYLLSAVVFLINGSVAGIAERFSASVRARLGKDIPRTALSRLRSLETVLVFLVIWALYQLPKTERTCEVPLRVALIQRNFPCVFKSREENPYSVYERLFKNVSVMEQDLVVLSESAMSEFGPLDQQGAIRFASWAQTQLNGAPLLAGGTRFGDGELFNSAALYTTQDPSANVSSLTPQIYDKVHLVPFGEFIPGDKLFPILQKLAPVGSCTAGSPKLLVLPLGGESVRRPEPREIPFGVAICFEDTDSALVRQLAAEGACFLCFITNDSWFSHSNEALAHAWQATARAIETGLPVVRVGNSGVSGTIAPNGRSLWLVNRRGKPLIDRAGTMFDRLLIAEKPSPTPYVVVGDFPLFLLFALLMMGMIVVKYTPTYGKL